MQSIISTTQNGTLPTLTLTGPFTAGAFIRFTVSALDDGNDLVSIDNINIVSTTQTINYETTFTENGADQDIAVNPLIIESDQIVSARIILTNAQLDDTFDIPGNLPATSIAP